eukprot:5530752-Pleurochrysis_carterae.AAC.1
MPAQQPVSTADTSLPTYSHSDGHVPCTPRSRAHDGVGPLHAHNHSSHPRTIPGAMVSTVAWGLRA